MIPAKFIPVLNNMVADVSMLQKFTSGGMVDMTPKQVEDKLIRVCLEVHKAATVFTYMDPDFDGTEFIQEVVTRGNLAPHIGQRIQRILQADLDR